MKRTLGEAPTVQPQNSCCNLQYPSGRLPCAGAVYVRRHTDHSANIVVRHNPNRSELPRLPAVVDDRKAAAQVGVWGLGSGLGRQVDWVMRSVPFERQSNPPM